MLDALTNQESSHYEGRCWAIHVQELGYDDITNYPAKASGDHRYSDPSCTQLRREHLGNETIQRRIAATYRATEDSRHGQILIFVVHEV